MATWPTAVTLTSALLLLAFFIAFDAVAKRTLWNSSADFQESIQSESSAAKSFFSFVATASLIVSATLQSVFYYGFSPSLGMNLVAINALGTSLPSVLKMAYSDPRPYWEYEGVRAINCETGWGNPSGHALYTGSVWFSLCFSLVIWKKTLWTLPVICWVALVGFDRLFLGVHFYSQVVLGWTFALALAATHYRFHNSADFWLPKANRLFHLLSIHILAGVFVLVSVSLYLFRSPYWDATWTARIHSKCDVSYSLSDAKSSALYESGLIAFLPGAVLGYFLAPSLANYCIQQAWYKRICVILLSLVPLGLQAGGLQLSKSGKIGGAWSGWGFVLAVSYICGVAFTAGVQGVARVGIRRETGKGRDDISEEDKPLVAR